MESLLLTIYVINKKGYLILDFDNKINLMIIQR